MTPSEAKAAILAADDTKTKQVETPEWAPSMPCVWVQSLTADELCRLGALEDETKEMIHCAAMALVTEEGTPLGFGADELVLLGEKSAGVIKRISDAALVLTGIKEDPAKNSPATTGAAGGSDSASTTGSPPGSSPGT